MESKKTILVVEDERPLLVAIDKKLTREGFEVLLARTVEQALGYLEDPDINSIDAVWLDHYLLGESTGLEFLATLRTEGGQSQETPVFVVTNTGGEDKRQTYLELGATSYYVKANNSLADIIADIKEALVSQ